MTKAHEFMLSRLSIKNCMINMYKLKYTYNVSNNHHKKRRKKNYIYICGLVTLQFNRTNSKQFYVFLTICK